MNNDDLDRLQERVEVGFRETGESVVSAAPGFSWHTTFLRDSLHYEFEAILVFTRWDSLDELVAVSAELPKAAPQKWTMDLTGPSLVLEDRRCRAEDRWAAMAADARLASDAILDFLARARPVIVQELTDEAG